MNFQQLETFLQIARLGSLSKAAERLHATQSAVSMRLADLERELGVELVDRRYRPCRLTSKGRDLVAYADEVVTLTQHIRHRVGDPAQLTGSVKIGVGEHVALTWLPDLVAELNRRHPDVVVELDIGLLEQMTAQLRSGEFDILLTAAQDNSEPDISYRPLGSERFVWMASPALNLPETPLSPDDLSHWPVLTMSRASVLHRLMENWFKTGAARPRQVNVCNSLSACASLTRAGLGVGLLPRSYRESGLVELHTEPPLDPTPFYAMHNAQAAPPLAGIIAELAEAASTFP
ncbi:MAG: LysR family transcriptional regulator [Alphaproteobacteria bacterium]|nr:LysR family transcriptional regulator [Alphaproteobacteria bacterium]